MIEIENQADFKKYMQTFTDAKGSPVATLKVLLNSNGYFEIPLLILSYIEYFGGLYTGKGRKAKVSDGCEFVKAYFPSKYAGVIGLIFAMWRNGLAHEHAPKTINFYGKTIKWRSALSDEYTQEHLKIKNVGDDVFVLTLCAPEFIRDFENALESFERDIWNDGKLFEKVKKAYDDYQQPDNCISGKPYLNEKWLRSQLK